MAPSNLQGLNIFHPRQDSSDSQDLLAYPDLSAQLDLWTNLTFDSDEPYGHRHDDHKSSNAAAEEEEARSPVTAEKAVRDGHLNVVTPTNVVVNQPNNPSNAASQLFDINSLFAGFTMEPYSGQPSQPPQLPSMTPSLAQILALHSNAVSFHLNPVTDEKPATLSHPSPSSEESLVPVKRARTRKASIIAVDSDYREDSVAPSDATGNPLSAAEDKRRRNTAASARFRLKKKEREAALEGKAKELEAKVNDLERECEGLRRENGWLKGLVVGVTGAAHGPGASQGLTVPSPPPGAVPRTKRRRGETEST